MTQWEGGKGSMYRSVDKQKFNESFDRIFKKELCGGCEKVESKSSHPCPYKVEMFEDYNSCNCCDSCRHECLMDI